MTAPSDEHIPGTSNTGRKYSGTGAARTTSPPAGTSRPVTVPWELLTEASLPPEARIPYAVLAGMTDRNQECSVAQPQLQAIFLWKRSTLKKYLESLSGSGWLQITPGKGKLPSTYRLRNPYVEKRKRELAALQTRLDKAEYRGEALMREWLNLLVDSPRYYDHARPDFLANPLTDQPMEYDRWYPPAVAFEFNGPQHYGATDLFPDEEAARQVRARDAMKRGISAENGVTLVIIQAKDLTLEGMRRKIGNLLPTRPVHQDDMVLRYLTVVSHTYRRKSRGGTDT